MTARRIKAASRNKACRLAGLLIFALLLAGCDSCGDWVSPLGSQACHQQAPRQQ
jgi:hypothetical protein